MLKNYFRALKDILFPSLCFCCESKINHTEYLCASCKKEISFLTPPLCKLCSTPIKNNEESVCRKCINKKVFYDKVMCITRYTNSMKLLIHLFKYKNYDFLSEFFDSLMPPYLAKIGFNASGYDFIIPTPMHAVKLKMRGYNQADLLAQSLANYFKMPLKKDIIYEKKLKVSQTKLKKEARNENTKNMFVARKDTTGKKIIIVDDIFTTGATANACAYALKEKGAKNILVIALSKTQ